MKGQAHAVSRDLLSADRAGKIYGAFLASDSAQAMLATMPHPQVYLDFIVGHYLDGGEEDLHDPRLFDRIMQFRETLQAAERGDLSLLPGLAFVREPEQPSGYDVMTDTIRLSRRKIHDLDAMVKQIEEALPTVLVSRHEDP